MNPISSPMRIRLVADFASVISFVMLAVGAAGPLLRAAPETFKVEMRDGTHLGTDVYRPEGAGPWPVIMLRFPYNKVMGEGIGPEVTKRGYVFVAQDTRGRFASEGENLPFDADGRADNKWDGFDTAAWIAKQPWCNGRLGTWGASAGAITQYFLAGTGQANVVSQHLTVGTPSLFLGGVYRGGILRKAMVEGWLKETKFAPEALDRWTKNYPYTDYWKNREIVRNYGQVRAQGVHIGGWFDIFAQPTIEAFLGYQNQGGEGARGRQKLVMGPWTHGVLHPAAGDLRFPGADKPPGDIHDPWKWFAATLKGEANGILDRPAVTYYVMGASGEAGAPGNVWRTAEQWPPVKTIRKTLHLHADKSVSWTEPGLEGRITYTSDPAHPVPSIGGYELNLPAGPKDQRSIESRPDLVVFTTAPLDQPMEVTGNAVAHVTVSATTPDADLVVRLCDVYPDGRSFNICEGALRLRFRDGMDRPSWLTPGQPVTVEVPLWPTSIIFNKGHSLRVHIASSSAPALEPNLQNGEAPRTGDARSSEMNILLGAGRTCLDLPVAPGP